ncbi:MAG: hypothetical protein Q9M31_00150 [Mariprofundus sp.]|nr:hypothetical protein [Mariprofundus sp.]
MLHEAPDCHRHGVKALSELGALLGVRLIVHGHHHTQYTAVLDSGIAVVGLELAQVATLDIDLFTEAQSVKEITAVFYFGFRAKRGGGWADE